MAKIWIKFLNKLKIEVHLFKWMKNMVNSKINQMVKKMIKDKEIKYYDLCK